MLEFDEKVFYAIISILISVGIFFAVNYFLKRFFSVLKGTAKLTGIISIGIIAGEILYLGTSFNIFSLAIETIIAVGGAVWFLLLALQNHLKNISSGLSNYLNPEIDVGDMIEINDQKDMKKNITKVVEKKKIKIKKENLHKKIDTFVRAMNNNKIYDQV